MKRTISKRFEVNETEAKVLKMKSEQCGLAEGEYIRELIMNSQPVEAPPRQFYESMSGLNQIVVWIQDILMKSENAIPQETMESMRGIYSQLVDQIVAIKEIVSKARFFAPDAYEQWEHEAAQARKEGREPPALDDYLQEKSRREIRHPATDMSLGWNALGIRPPFLQDTGEAEDRHLKTEKPDKDGWQTVDESESVTSYAETSILTPPRKDGGP